MDHSSSWTCLACHSQFPENTFSNNYDTAEYTFTNVISVVVSMTNNHFHDALHISGVRTNTIDMIIKLQVCVVRSVYTTCYSFMK